MQEICAVITKKGLVDKNLLSVDFIFVYALLLLSSYPTFK